MKLKILGAIALISAAGTAHAASYTYNFKGAADSGGAVGEAIFSTFDTSQNGVFSGPKISITATKMGNPAFVYFDKGNAGIGVCGTGFKDSAKNTSETGTYKVGDYNPGSGSNLCNPSSDDGLTTSGATADAGETLTFTAGSGLRITSFSLNSNHDTASILGTKWSIGGVEYDIGVANPAIDIDGVTPGVGKEEGDVVISTKLFLKAGQSIDLFGLMGANSYISSMTVAPVPLPAAGWMLLAGLAGLGFAGRRKAAG